MKFSFKYLIVTIRISFVSITYDEDTNKLTVKLNPIFEHLRQIKLQKKQEFSQSLETLTGTLEIRSQSAKQTLRNDTQNLNNIVMIGTRRNIINTEIEPNNEGSKKSNVGKKTVSRRSHRRDYAFCL